MKLSKFIFFIFIVFTYATSRAFDYQITCQNKSLVGFESAKASPQDKECQAFMKNGFSKCFESQKSNANPNAITISTPYDHYYKAKESTFYSKKEIKELIQQTVKDGNDPYLMLAIILLENPPMISKKNKSYSNAYGQIPMNLIAAADTFGCDMQVTKGREKSFINSKKMPPFEMDPRGESKFVCLNKAGRVTDPPTFDVFSNPTSNRCCSKVTLSRKDINHSALTSKAHSKMLRMVSDRYVKSKFSYAFKLKAQYEKKPEEKMAMLAQSFNGYGQFGFSEKTANQCLYRIDTSKTPVYGAGASELMLNSIMNNTEIKNMASAAIKQNNAKPTSYLCWSYGDGTHTVASTSFTKLLDQHLGGRKNCPVVTNKIKEVKSGESMPQQEKSPGVRSAI